MKKQFKKVIKECVATRKPESFKSIDTDFDTELVEYFRVEVIPTLPIFTKKDLGIKKPIDFFKIENVPNFFVLHTEKQRYLVATECHNYCRYITKINS